MTAAVRLPRRSFLRALALGAGGLGLMMLEGKVAAAPAKGVAKAAQSGVQANAFVHVADDGTVSIVCARSEMGQGVRSSLPALIADELGADLARIRIVQADASNSFGSQNTDGSTSVRKGFEDLRKVGATARALLIAAAAEHWGVAKASCEARDHAVWHRPTRRSLGFGALASPAAKLPLPDPKTVELRPRSELHHLGTELPLVDADAIVTGRAVYGADVRVPGMLVAVIAHPPTVGGKVKRLDAARALAVPGVRQVIELPVPSGAPKFQPLGGVAVVADHTWAAMLGRAALDIEWDLGPNATYDSAAFKDTLLAAVRAPGKVERNGGDVDAALTKAVRTVEAEYYVPHLAHAAMEPPVALARVTADGCEVWTSIQAPQEARAEVAHALSLDESKVTVHVTLLGGGFGRKSKPDFVVEAALLSRATGAPVRVQWTREDDIRHGYFHTVSAQALVAGLDAQGKVVAWRHRSAFPSISSTFDTSAIRPSVNELGQGVLDLPLDVPNVRAESGEAHAHVRIGWMRSVCNIFHGFAVGSFVDEIAHARGSDARETWLDLLGPARHVTEREAGVAKIPNYGSSLEEHPIDVGRHRTVIERVTAMAGWSSSKAAGRALGLSAHRSFLTSVAVVVSLVHREGNPGGVYVDEAWICADAGTIINSERVRAQLEGAVLFGISIALHGSITMKGGAVVQSNYRDYPVARIAEAPRAIHVEVIASDARPGGIGEPGVPPVAAAVANAYFALTGKRVRDLPLVLAEPAR